MKIAVIGAGIIGVTTAYELACDGHEVTVLERRGATAEEASFANAGVVTPGFITPWAAPGLPAKVLQQLTRQSAPFKLKWPLSSHELSWLWRWYRACQPVNYLANLAQLQRLAFYSRERLHNITADLKLEYERSDGYMLLLRDERDSQRLQPGLQILRAAGVVFNELDPGQARKIETALNPDAPLFGAIYLPEDEVANCRQFALLLKNEARRMGVEFLFNRSVTQVQSSGGIHLMVAGDAQPQPYDAVVLCAGLDSTPLLAPLGLKVALNAVYGYSVSATIRDSQNAPHSGVMDVRQQVSISRLGNRIRVAGSSEIGGAAVKKTPQALQSLYETLHRWFPGAADMAKSVQEWKGASSLLPDGTPLLGASGVAGLWLNLGHGASGWALSCGSARALADLITGRTPDLDVSGLDIGRLRA
jgi:D-amino-acid dehydrogenase